jgi:hypothetical protein
LSLFVVICRYLSTFFMKKYFCEPFTEILATDTTLIKQGWERGGRGSFLTVRKDMGWAGRCLHKQKMEGRYSLVGLGQEESGMGEQTRALGKIIELGSCFSEGHGGFWRDSGAQEKGQSNYADSENVPRPRLDRWLGFKLTRHHQTTRL